MATFQNLILVSAATTTALMAGLFYAYSCSVNPGLGRLADMDYLTAMQSINRAILNPVFFAGFIGTALLLPASTWLQYSQPLRMRFWLLLSASVLYLVGVFGVTIFGNVPLNEVLDLFNIQTASADDVAAQRRAFEIPWNKLHTIRTTASILALVLVIVACMSPSDND